jgi:hypothetical protein
MSAAKPVFVRANTIVLAAAATLIAAGLAAAAPTSSIRPAVSGSLKVGEKLTADRGTWAGSGDLQYGYAWYRCDPGGAHCKAIHGATADTYLATAGDTGRTIGLTVRATDTSGAANAYASLVGPIAGGTVYATAAPRITGGAEVGQQLKTDTGTWAVSPQLVAYQWLRCNGNGRICMPISGATDATYKAVDADLRHALVARVTVKVGTTAQAAFSIATPAIAAEGDALPTGATPLGKGRYSVPVESVSLPARLVVARVSAKASTLTVTIADTRGYAIRGAIVQVVAPYGWVAPVEETGTGNDGTVALELRAKAGHPRRIVLYVRARKPGDAVLAGITATRLVSVRLSS